MTTTPLHPDRRWDAVAAALASLALGALGGVLLVAGHHPWDGPEVTAFFGSHGLHRGDVLAVGPVAVGLAVATWCLRQNASRR